MLNRRVEFPTHNLSLRLMIKEALLWQNYRDRQVRRFGDTVQTDDENLTSSSRTHPKNSFSCSIFLPFFFHSSTSQAKQRASIKWLLSKAYNNRVPEQIREPFYTDHEGVLHLKPQIVVGLGNASIYCQVLANIYTDPNYQSLNHWSILQTLCRKGVPILDEREGEPPLTETVLIQTNPLKIVSDRLIADSSNPRDY